MATRPERDETDSFLMGGDKIPALFKKAHPEGSTFEGEVIDKRMAQQTDPATGDKKTWDDGNPMMQMVVTLQTNYDDEPNEDTDEDDGRRNLYVKGAMQKAISAAVRAAGESSFKIGGYLKIKHTSTAKPERRGLNGAKQFKAKYTAPDPNAETDEFLGDDEDDDIEPTPPPRKRTAAKKTSTRKTAPEPEPDDEDDDFDEEPEPTPPPRKRTAAKKTARTPKPPVDDEFEDDEDPGF